MAAGKVAAGDWADWFTRKVNEVCKWTKINCTKDN